MTVHACEEDIFLYKGVVDVQICFVFYFYVVYLSGLPEFFSGGRGVDA